LELSNTPKFSKKNLSLEAPITEDTWFRHCCRWISGASALSITTSITCHAAILAILLFDTPIPKDMDNPISVELVSSDLIRSNSAKTHQEVDKPENNLEVVSKPRSNDLEPRTNPMPPIEVNQKLDQTITSENLTKRSKLIPLKTEHINIPDEKQPSSGPQYSTTVPTPNRPNWGPTKKPKAPIMDEKTVKIANSSSFKPLKSVDFTVSQDLPAIAGVSVPPQTKELLLNERNTPLSLTRDSNQIPDPSPQVASISEGFNQRFDTNHSIKIDKINDITFSKELPKKVSNIETSSFRGQIAAIVSPRSRNRKLDEGITKSIGSERENADASPIAGNPKPLYPVRAVRKGLQGRVVLNVEVLPSGDAGILKTAISSGHWVLDQAAIKAVRQWQFTPAKLAGISVLSYVQVPIQFKLR